MQKHRLNTLERYISDLPIGTQILFIVSFCPFLPHKTLFTWKYSTLWDSNLPSTLVFLKLQIYVQIKVFSIQKMWLYRTKHKILLWIWSTIKAVGCTLVKRIPRNTRNVFSLSDNTIAKILSRTGISNYFN